MRVKNLMKAQGLCKNISRARLKTNQVLGVFLLLILSVSCVPVEKRTECSTNEAFNASLRTCVPTAGVNGSVIFITDSFPQGSVSTYVSVSTAINFSVTISDSYSKGYNTVWNLRKPDQSLENVTSGTDTASITPTSLLTTPGNYSLEVLVMDSTNSTIIASKSWSVLSLQDPDPVIVSTTPTDAIFTYNLTTPDISYTVAVNDNGYTGLTTGWYIDGIKSTTTGSTYNLSPASLTIGFHQLEAHIEKVISPGNVVSYDKKVWGVIIGQPNLTTLNHVEPTEGSVDAYDGVPINDSTGGFFVGGSNIADPNSKGFCIGISDFNGTRSVTGISNVYVKYYLDNTLLGGAVDFTGNGVDNKKCITDVTGYNNFSVSLSSQLSQIGENKVLKAVIYDKGVDGNSIDNPNLIVREVIWGLKVNPKNLAPIITSDTGGGTPTPNDPNDPNSTISIIQDTPVTFAFLVQDNNSKPENDSDFEVRWYLDGVLLDNINAYPNTTISTPDCYHTYNSGVSAPVLNTKYTCTVQVPAFSNSGSNTELDYTLTAVVTDTSLYPGGTSKDSNILNWNLKVQENQTAPTIVVFGAIGTSSRIAKQSSPGTFLGDVSTAPVKENDDVILSVIVNDVERDNYTRVLEICKVYDGISDPATASDCYLLSGQQTFTRTNGDLGHTSELSFRMPESALKGTTIVDPLGRAQIFVRVTVQDITDSIQGTIAKAILPIWIEDNNPIPVIDSANIFPALVPVLPLTTYNVYAGMPFTFYPGEVTDASLTDGAVIKYQWQVCATGGCTGPGEWANIVGAEEKDLVWTPPNDLANTVVKIRVCIGDDGRGHELILHCTGVPTAGGSPDTSKIAVVGPWENITIQPNTVLFSGIDDDGSPHIPMGETATWYDESQSDITVYNVSNTATQPTNPTVTGAIIVEKVVYMGDASGHVNSFDAIQFSTENGGSANVATDISIDGDPANDSLYIAYKVEDALTVPSLITTIRIRRIWTKNGLFGFNYSGQTISYTGAPPVTITPQGAMDDDIEVDFISNSWNPGDSIVINGASVTMVTTGTESTTELASMFAAAVNNNTDNKILYKVFAERVGTTVKISGLPTNDYIDIQLYAKKLGKIMVDSVNQKIHLPFIDGMNDDKISVISLSTQFKLGDSANNVVNYLTLNGTGSYIDFDNSLSKYSNRFFFAGINRDKYVYLLSYSDISSNAQQFISSSDTAIFSQPMERIKLATGSNGNGHLFILAENADEKLNLARVEEDGFNQGNNVSTIGTRSEPLDPDNTSQFKHLNDFQMVTIPNQPMGGIIFSSTNNNTNHDTTKKLRGYVSKISVTDTNLNTAPIMLGNSQTQVNSNTTSLVEDFNISMTPVFIQRTFGEFGYTTDENKSDVLFINYTTGNSAIPYKHGAFINTRDEQIQATEQGFTEGFAPAYFNSTSTATVAVP